MKPPEVLIRINGQNSDQISVLDHAFLYGFGLFETMRGYDGAIFCLQEHLDRLYQAAESLQWILPWEKKELQAAVLDTIQKVDHPDLYIRLNVTRGLGKSPDPTTCENPSYVVIVKPYHKSPLEGWDLKPVSIRRNTTSITSRIKSLNYLDSILAKQEAKANNAHEGLMLNEKGEVAEGSMSNLFIVTKAKTLATSNLESGILNGITRQVVLKLAKELHIPFEERIIELPELDKAAEIFCTSSLVELMPVLQWKNKTVGSGHIGPITQSLLNSYRDRVKL